MGCRIIDSTDSYIIYIQHSIIINHNPLTTPNNVDGQRNTDSICNQIRM